MFYTDVFFNVLIKGVNGQGIFTGYYFFQYLAVKQNIISDEPAAFF